MSNSSNGGLRPFASQMPSATRQCTYLGTGALAGACTVPIDVVWQRFSSHSPRLAVSLARDISPPLIYRAAIRFWIFDLTKSQLNRMNIPTWTKGGLAGATGGFAEICAQSLFHRSPPTVASLTNQSAKLFFCFGTYTWLSTTLSPDQSPPKPFWYCWLLGAAAGGFGSGIIARAEGIKGKALLRGPVPKGMASIGTVIAVQVTSSAAVLEWMKD